MKNLRDFIDLEASPFVTTANIDLAFPTAWGQCPDLEFPTEPASLTMDKLRTKYGPN